MNYIALSGNGHSLRRYFNSRVTCLDAPSRHRLSWSRKQALRVAESIYKPTVVIGFSAGATAALHIAIANNLVLGVYAHSPMDRISTYECPFAVVCIFRTNGDTTPTYEGALDAYLKLCTSQWPETPALRNLDPVDPEPIRDPATFVMWRRTHQFRNCLSFLPKEILR